MQVNNKRAATRIAADITVSAAKKRLLKKAVLSKPEDKTILRAVLTEITVGGAPNLQAEFFTTDNKAKHKNIPLDGNAPSALTELFSAFFQINIITEVGECQYKRSKSGSETLLSGSRLEEALSKASVGDTLRTNDREKNYILNGSEPFLAALGISDKNGRVFDKKQAKFRQINRFCEIAGDIYDNLPQSGTLYICDLCCGKSYLSFALYHYFANVKKRDVVMSGVDLKADCVAYCSEVANKLGFTGLSFVCRNINDFTPDNLPHLVVSLHACDTATDVVLNKAAEWNTPVILSTPCCHHELNKTIDCPTLSFITDHSMLRQKLCDAATDAMRLLKLEAEGYSVCALELIDPEDTPKNILLRAVKRKTPNLKKENEAREKYNAAKLFFTGKPE